MMNRNLLKSAAATAIVLTGLSACTSNPYTGERQASKTGVGAGVGAVVGALGGILVGGSSRKSALIGAGIGALAGGAAGAYMDNQASELRKQLQGTGVSVTRNGDAIVLNMPGNVTFETDSNAIQGQFYSVLDSVVLVLNKYKQTYVDVLGFTDSSGSESYNLQLSLRRAQSVADYFTSKGVTPQRLVVRGLGEANPVASNDTPQGKALNRRVEITLTPLT